MLNIWKYGSTRNNLSYFNLQIPDLPWMTFDFVPIFFDFYFIKNSTIFFQFFLNFFFLIPENFFLSRLAIPKASKSTPKKCRNKKLKWNTERWQEPRPLHPCWEILFLNRFYSKISSALVRSKIKNWLHSVNSVSVLSKALDLIQRNLYGTWKYVNVGCILEKLLRQKEKKEIS